jgi:hypothetical protein
MPTVARLTNTDLIVESEFDEITQSAIAVTDLAFYPWPCADRPMVC